MRFPFALPPSHIIKVDDKPFRLAGYDATLRRNGDHYVLRVSSFADEKAAWAFEENLRYAALSTALKRTRGIRFAMPGALTLHDAPLPMAEGSDFRMVTDQVEWSEVDGWYDDGYTVVIPEHLRLLRFGAGRATVVVSTPTETFAADLEAALSAPSLDRIGSNAKLRLAIEVYSSSFFELEGNARFIRLVTVLECLVPKVPASETALRILDRLHRQVKEERDQHNQTTVEYAETVRLLNRVAKLRKESISESLRRFVRETMENAPSLGDPDEIVPQVTDSYKARSGLLHDGVADAEKVREATGFLAGFVPKLLGVLAGLAEPEVETRPLTQ